MAHVDGTWTGAIKEKEKKEEEEEDVDKEDEKTICAVLRSCCTLCNEHSHIVTCLYKGRHNASLPHISKLNKLECLLFNISGNLLLYDINIKRLENMSVSHFNAFYTILSL